MLASFISPAGIWGRFTLAYLQVNFRWNRSCCSRATIRRRAVHPPVPVLSICLCVVSNAVSVTPPTTIMNNYDLRSLKSDSLLHFLEPQNVSYFSTLLVNLGLGQRSPDAFFALHRRKQASFWNLVHTFIFVPLERTCKLLASPHISQQTNIFPRLWKQFLQVVSNKCLFLSHPIFEQSFCSFDSHAHL